MNNTRAFTLIELLVVLAIVSIISAIALPEFAEFRAKGFDMRAMHDLRTVAIAEEAYFIDSELYLSCTDSGCSKLPGIAKISKGVSLEIIATQTGFAGTSTHPKGSGKIFKWDSTAGGLQ